MSETTVVNVRTDEYDVYIGRVNGRYGLKRSIWANPFRIGPDGSRADVLYLYEHHVRSFPALMARLPELRGKRLGCWCAPEPCHGDVLVKLLKEMDE